MPIPVPITPTRASRSSGSTNSAISAVKIGAAATRMPASDELIDCSPALISRNGSATWMSASTTTSTQRAASPASAPRRHAIGARAAAASAVRRKTTACGERSRSPILMKRYEAPQSEARRSSEIQARRGTRARLSLLAARSRQALDGAPDALRPPLERLDGLTHLGQAVLHAADVAADLGAQRQQFGVDRGELRRDRVAQLRD